MFTQARSSAENAIVYIVQKISFYSFTKKTFKETI